ncbi:MAG: LytTR family DNA-binding domain-containing protein [Rikenellaceae bacterium]
METNYLFFNSRDELLRMDVSKIVYFEADGNYTKIILANKLCGVICMNLAQTEKALATQLKEKAQSFARIGKRYIINLRYIYQINTIKQRLVLTDYKMFSYQLEVSKDALKKLKEIIITSVTNKL